MVASVSQGHIVRVTTDRGSLRLQFQSRLSRHFWGKRQYYKPLGKQDNRVNREWASRIAARIEADLLHPDSENLFDPSLEKYLGAGTGKLIADQLSQPLTLQDLWQEFIDYKLKTGQISETTYRTKYRRTFTNWLKPYLDAQLTFPLAEQICFDLQSQNVNRTNLKKLISALAELNSRAIAQRKLSENYFAGLVPNIKAPKKSQQLTEEEDYRAFTKEERDIILHAFATSDKQPERQISHLVGFLFLTGCRLGEAFALRWVDVKTNWIVFDESYSSETGLTKGTKTDTVRIFRTKNYHRLQALLKQLAKKPHSSSDFVFRTARGSQYNRYHLCFAWTGKDRSTKTKKNYVPGVVTRLAQQGKIAQYLKPSATRHTFISLQAHAGTDLKLLADSVGNSVDTIYTHYLGVNREATIADL